MNCELLSNRLQARNKNPTMSTMGIHALRDQEAGPFQQLYEITLFEDKLHPTMASDRPNSLACKIETPRVREIFTNGLARKNNYSTLSQFFSQYRKQLWVIDAMMEALIEYDSVEPLIQL